MFRFTHSTVDIIDIEHIGGVEYIYIYILTHVISIIKLSSYLPYHINI